MIYENSRILRKKQPCDLGLRKSYGFKCAQTKKSFPSFHLYWSLVAFDGAHVTRSDFNKSNFSRSREAVVMHCNANIVISNKRANYASIS